MALFAEGSSTDLLPDSLGNQITSLKKDENNPKRHTLPKYASGARTLIRIGGKPIGVALDFKWSVSAQATEVRTIDTNLPWDLVPNQIMIAGTLNQIMDPLDSLEKYAIFSTMQAMIHQPLVELQLLDVQGVSIVLMRGMFTGVSGSMSHGQLMNISANFQGVLWQHNVAQEFTPYSLVGDLFESVTDALGGLSSLSGGFL